MSEKLTPMNDSILLSFDRVGLKHLVYLLRDKPELLQELLTHHRRTLVRLFHPDNGTAKDVVGPTTFTWLQEAIENLLRIEGYLLQRKANQWVKSDTEHGWGVRLQANQANERLEQTTRELEQRDLEVTRLKQEMKRKNQATNDILFQVLSGIVPPQVPPDKVHVHYLRECCFFSEPEYSDHPKYGITFFRQEIRYIRADGVVLGMTYSRRIGPKSRMSNPEKQRKIWQEMRAKFAEVSEGIETDWTVYGLLVGLANSHEVLEKLGTHRAGTMALPDYGKPLPWEKMQRLLKLVSHAVVPAGLDGFNRLVCLNPVHESKTPQFRIVLSDFRNWERYVPDPA